MTCSSPDKCAEDSPCYCVSCNVLSAMQGSTNREEPSWLTPDEEQPSQPKPKPNEKTPFVQGMLGGHGQKIQSRLEPLAMICMLGLSWLYVTGSYRCEVFDNFTCATDTDTEVNEARGRETRLCLVLVHHYQRDSCVLCPIRRCRGSPLHHISQPFL